MPRKKKAKKLVATMLPCGRARLDVKGRKLAHFADIKFTNLADCADDEANAHRLARGYTYYDELVEMVRWLRCSSGCHCSQVATCGHAHDCYNRKADELLAKCNAPMGQD